MFRNLFDAPHLIIVVLLIVIIFAAPKLPRLARNLGQSLKIFKSEVKDLRDDKPASGSDAAETERPLEGRLMNERGGDRPSASSAGHSETRSGEPDPVQQRRGTDI